MFASKESLLDRFQYNRDANQLFNQTITKSKNRPNPVIKLFSHIYNAHLVWLDRIHTLKDEPIPDIWEIHDPEKFESLNTRCYELTEWFIQAENYGMPLGRIIRYQNSQGRPFENTIEEIYTHLLFHSMYHRGQVAKYMREEGIQPPVTDFIMMNRKELTEPVDS